MAAADGALRKIGCFGLTEPLVGSGAAGGLLTTAKREGHTWVLNGQKRWIGNSPWCDVSVIWARDVADNQVKAFIVENKTTPGFSVEKIQNKIALKVVQNGQICAQGRSGTGGKPPPERQLVPRYRKSVAPDPLRRGLGRGRMPDGRLRARGQIRTGAPAVRKADRLVPARSGPARQDAWQRHGIPGMVVRAAQLEAQGKLTDQHAAVAKAFTTARTRETVAWARELLGGNGIVADYNGRAVLRGCRGPLHLRGHVSDAEPDPRQGHHRPRRVRVNKTDRGLRPDRRRPCPP